MVLLDIISGPRVIREVIRVVEKSQPEKIPDSLLTDPLLDSDTVMVDSTVVDSIASLDIVGGQQVSDIAPVPPSILDMTGGELIWTILVVLVALSLCFYFAKCYRQRRLK